MSPKPLPDRPAESQLELAATRAMASRTWKRWQPRFVTGDAVWKALGYGSRRSFNRALEAAEQAGTPFPVRLTKDARGAWMLRSDDAAAWAWAEYLRLWEAFAQAKGARRAKRKEGAQ